MSDTVPKDYLMPVLIATLCAAILAIGAVTNFTLRREPPEPIAPVIQSAASVGPIARAGEWITNPEDGSRVCRLRTAIVRGMTFTRNLCEDWQGPVPQWAQTVPWLRWTPNGGGKIMVEGRWRP